MKVLLGFAESQKLGGAGLIVKDRASAEYSVEITAKGDARGGNIYPLSDFLVDLGRQALASGALSPEDAALWNRVVNPQGWFTKTVTLSRDEAERLNQFSSRWMTAAMNAANAAGWASVDVTIDITLRPYAGIGQYLAERGTTGLSADQKANLDSQIEQWAASNAAWLLDWAKTLGVSVAVLVGIAGLAGLLVLYQVNKGG